LAISVAFEVTVKPEDLAPIGSWIENIAWVDAFIGDVKVVDAKLSNTVGVEVIPEPATVLFIGLGLLGLLALVWRRKMRR